MTTLVTMLGNTIAAYWDGTNIAVTVDGVAATPVTPSGTPSSITLYEEYWGQLVLAYQVGTSAPTVLRSDDRAGSWS